MISLFSQGVFVFDPSTGKKQPFTIIDAQTTTRLCNRGKTVNLYQNSPDNVLLLSDHVYQYDLNKHTFQIVTEQEGEDIIGTLLPITNHEKYTYLNDIKHIYELDKENNRLTSLFRCFKDTRNLYCSANRTVPYKTNIFPNRAYLVDTEIFTWEVLKGYYTSTAICFRPSPNYPSYSYRM